VSKKNRFAACMDTMIQVADINCLLADHACQSGSYIAIESQLLFVQKGKGALKLNDKLFALRPGHLAIITKGSKVEISSHLQSSLQYVIVDFTYSIATNKGPHYTVYQREAESFPLVNEIQLGQYAGSYVLFEQFLESRQVVDRYERQFIQNRLFYQVLYLACKQLELGSDNQSAFNLEKTVEYIHNHYSEPITLEQLALMAGFSNSYYSRSFKKHTGIGPIAYVNKLRIEKAKELLIVSRNSLYQIAGQLGYSDESYFSRIFKKEVGISPLQYMKQYRKKIVLTKPSFNGDLLALGVVPYASVPSYAGVNQMLVNTKFIEKSNKLQLNDLALLEPDVIVCDGKWIDEHQEMSKVAPTIVIPYWEMNWRDRLLQMAELTGKQKEAKAWLKKYENKAAEVSRIVRTKIGSDTVTVIRIVGGKLRVYGVERNIGYVLYHDLELMAPPLVRAIKWRKTIEFAELLDYDAQHLLLMVSSTKQDDELLEHLLQSTEWSQFTAVREQNWTMIDSYPWIDYSAISHDKMLDAVKLIFS